MPESIGLSPASSILPSHNRSWNSLNPSSSSLKFKPSIASSATVIENQVVQCPRSRSIRGRTKALVNQGSVLHEQQEHEFHPLSVDLLPICSETQFDQVLEEARQLQQPLIIVWMAQWCRKCIYLKPKLEKLAASNYPRLQFYCVDVNEIPHKLVARAGVTKMPTIQLWKDCGKQAEVIGSHKAHLVINEVSEMIENESEA